MKPKSGIAGDERNIAVLLFLYVLQVGPVLCYILTSIWVLRISNASQNLLYHFLCKKAVKSKKIEAKLSKKICFCVKMFQKHISTSIWSAQHPNVSQNIQHA